jgi:pimeloyl-ACP methyl ester carboxylesterase
MSDRGHEVRTVKLRGHDRPQGRIWYRVSDYVEDIRQSVATFSALPVLVGHSMGGLVVQKYLERYHALGAVLMAPLPIHGTLSAVARLLRRHPMMLLKATFLLRLQPFISTRELVRDLFFTPDTPQATVDTCFARLVDESYLAFMDTMFVLPRPRRIHVSVLVLGAGRDGFLPLVRRRGQDVPMGRRQNYSRAWAMT